MLTLYVFVYYDERIFAYCPIYNKDLCESSILRIPTLSNAFQYPRSSLTFQHLLLLYHHGNLIAQAGEGEVAVAVLSHGRHEVKLAPVSVPGQQLDGLSPAQR